MTWENHSRALSLILWGVIIFLSGSATGSQCPSEPPLQNFTGNQWVACPCFVPGEEAGVLLEPPPDHYPLQILEIGIGWSSEFGDKPISTEAAIHIYGGAGVQPGPLLYSYAHPELRDGSINLFDVENLLPKAIIESGPFVVALEFANQNALNPAAPSLLHDGNGCRGGKNWVFAIPGGWFDACLLGVTGDWLIHVVYRQMSCNEEGPFFVRGDVNRDGAHDIADAVCLLGHLFGGGDDPCKESVLECLDASDANDDGTTDISDAIKILSFLFAGSGDLPEPFSGCSEDPTNDALECVTFEPCSAAK